MRIIRDIRNVAFFVFLVIVLGHANAQAQAQDLSEYELGHVFVEDLISRHGVCRSIRVEQRVTAIAQKILRVSDQRADVFFTFIVLNSDTIAAYALPGGFIVLTKGLVGACKSDDELAFLLAHEIAHEIKGHVDAPVTEVLRKRYRDRILSLGATGLGLVNEICKEIKKEHEREADRLGVLYAMLANYDVTGALSVFDHILGEENVSGTHPPKAERVEIVKNQFSKVAQSADTFYLAVGLYLSKRYDASLLLMKMCQSVFPSKVVYHNIGTVYLAKAIDLRRDEAYERVLHELRSVTPGRWSMEWLEPTGILVLDVPIYREMEKVEGYPPLGFRGGKTYFEHYLRQAISRFKRSTECDSKYIPSYVNWANALLQLGSYEEARLLLDRVLLEVPSDPLLLNNRGVALFGLKDYSSSLHAFRKSLEWKGRLPEGRFASPFFNIGVALMREGDEAGAQDAFCKYLRLCSNDRAEWRGSVARALVPQERGCERASAEKSGRILKEESWLLKAFRPGRTIRTEVELTRKTLLNKRTALSVATVEKEDFRCTMILEGDEIVVCSLVGPGVIEGCVDLPVANSLLQRANGYPFNSGMAVELEQGIILYGGEDRISRLTLYK